jgi:hypothetical protein
VQASLYFLCHVRRRLGVYFFGVGLGLILTWALVIRNRNKQDLLFWLPEERVLEVIRSDSNLEYSETFWCRMKCLQFSSIDLDQLLQEGDVNFANRREEGEQKIYQIDYNVEPGKKMSVEVALFDREAKLINVFSSEELKCDCP